MKNLKKLRIQNKLTQKKLAEKLNISQAAIHCYESGNKEASYKTAETIADYFGVTIDYLLGREPDSGLVYVHKDPALTEDEKHVLELYRNIVPESRELTLSILEQMPKVSQDKKQSKKDV